jgi:hypothetical protein
MSFMRTESEAEAPTQYTELQIHIDGEFVCAIPHSGEPQEGQTIEDPRITEALGKLEVLDVSFMGNMVFIKTERSEEKTRKRLKANQTRSDFQAAIDRPPVPDPNDRHSVDMSSVALGSITRMEVEKNE